MLLPKCSTGDKDLFGDQVLRCHRSTTYCFRNILVADAYHLATSAGSSNLLFTTVSVLLQSIYEGFFRKQVRPRQTSRREDRHIIRQACVEPTASLAAVQTPAAPSLQVLVPSRSFARRMAAGHLVSRCPLRVLPMTPTPVPPFGVLSCTTGLDCNGMEQGRLPQRL
ncbi:HTH_Tnp_Tc3_2 domain-containing protein [Trichonephila clavipes]|nr:HTH_Tnp_Tc3_2 domain-containing protein [Trichonephila clavipes]